MSLKTKIEQDFTAALKSQDADIMSTLRLLKAVILNKEKEKRGKIAKNEKEIKEADLVAKSVLTDEEIIDLIFSEIKKRKEAILLYRQGKREELAVKEEKEIEILKKYLPEQVSEKEIEDLARIAIQKLQAKSVSDMGKVMKELTSQIKGKAEPRIVSEIIKKLLQS